MSGVQVNSKRSDVVMRDRVFIVDGRRITVPSQKRFSDVSSKPTQIEFILNEARDTETGKPVDEATKSKIVVSISEIYSEKKYKIID